MELEELRKRKTSWDFTKYDLTIEKSDNCLIHTLHNGGASCGKVIFINTKGIMAVTGDFYNWIFCREFHPSEDGYVSEDYWCEKLQIASGQNGYIYDSDKTDEELNRMIKIGCEEYGYEGDELEQMKQYYSDCLMYTDDKEEYRVYAYDNLPDFVDYESIIEEEVIQKQLLIIFDAFNEICNRLSNN
jgi:hypothetical protein